MANPQEREEPCSRGASSGAVGDKLDPRAKLGPCRRQAGGVTGLVSWQLV